jgi:hypothetical protein
LFHIDPIYVADLLPFIFSPPRLVYV